MTRRGLLALVLLAPDRVPAQLRGFDFPLRLDRIAASLAALSETERRRLDTAIDLIRRGEHLAAFAPLAELSRTNPRNSGVRLLAAYVALQAGNLAGAFDHAKASEKAKDRTSYSCLLLARISALTGDLRTCRRELQHLQHDSEFGKEAQAIRTELEARGKQTRP